MVRPKTVSDEQVLASARRCFHQHGPQTSTATIAAEVGVSPQALLKRFGSKRALLLAALAPLQPDLSWIHAIARGPDDRPIREQLLGLALTLADFFSEVGRTAAILQWNGVSAREWMSRYETPPPVLGIAAVRAWLSAAAAQGRVSLRDPEAAAVMFIGMVQFRGGLVAALGDAAEASRPAYLARLVDGFCAGIGAGNGAGGEGGPTG